MNRILCFTTALIWTVVAYWLFAMHSLSEGLGSVVSFMFGMNPIIARNAREQVYGREIHWFLLGSVVAIFLAIYCALAGLKKRNQSSR
jgi:hypothetical protein